MTVEDFMTETVTVREPTGFTQSASGEPTTTYTESTTVMYLEPQEDTRRSTEALEVGYVGTGLWLGIGRADFAFNSHQQIVWQGHLFDILTPPRVMPNPLRHTMSHTELVLQEIEGEAAVLDEEGGFSGGFSGGFETVPVEVDAVAMPAAVGGVGGT